MMRGQDRAEQAAKARGLIELLCYGKIKQIALQQLNEVEIKQLALGLEVWAKVAKLEADKREWLGRIGHDPDDSFASDKALRRLLGRADEDEND
jgi:hypothetical protein